MISPKKSCLQDRKAFDKTMELMEADIGGKAEIPGVLNVGDIDKADGKAQAAKLDEKFVRCPGHKDFINKADRRGRGVLRWLYQKTNGTG